MLRSFLFWRIFGELSAPTLDFHSRPPGHLRPGRRRDPQPFRTISRRCEIVRQFRNFNTISITTSSNNGFATWCQGVKRRKPLFYGILNCLPVSHNSKRRFLAIRWPNCLLISHNSRRLTLEVPRLSKLSFLPAAQLLACSNHVLCSTSAAVSLGYISDPS